MADMVHITGGSHFAWDCEGHKKTAAKNIRVKLILFSRFNSLKINPMKITILTDNPKSWIIPYVKNLKEELIQKYEVTHIFSSKDIAPGDVMLILSCEKILKNTHLSFIKVILLFIPVNFLLEKVGHL